ncbi:unnamed protein product, partial [Urochloa humidicola]
LQRHGDLFRLPPHCDILFVLTRWRAAAEIGEVEVVRGGAAHKHSHRRQCCLQCTAVKVVRAVEPIRKCNSRVEEEDISIAIIQDTFYVKIKHYLKFVF